MPRGQWPVYTSDAYSWAMVVRVKGLIVISVMLLVVEAAGPLKDGRCEGPRERALDGLERSRVGEGTKPSIVCWTGFIQRC